MCWLACCDCQPVVVFWVFLKSLQQGQSPRLVCIFYILSRHIFGQKIELSITPNLSALYHKEIERKDVWTHLGTSLYMLMLFINKPKTTMAGGLWFAISINLTDYNSLILICKLLWAIWLLCSTAQARQNGLCKKGSYCQAVQSSVRKHWYINFMNIKWCRVMMIAN